MAIYTTKEKQKEFIQRYRQSGMTKCEFARLNNIHMQTFYSWFLKEKKQERLDFISLKKENIFSKIKREEINHNEKIILKTKSGLRIEIPKSISPSWLSLLLRELL